MINVSSEELGAIIAKIDDAIALHDKWRERFQRDLICRLPPPDTELNAHAHELCAFGRWLYGKGNAHMLAMPAFQSIEALHRKMHVKVRELYEKRLAGRSTGVDDYDDYLGTAISFRDQLNLVKERVAFMLHNIDPLTGAYRQSQLLPELRAEQQRQRETGAAYSLLLIDLDLKEINQRLGHDTGDKVLQTAIANVRQALGARDRIYRLVGAEFVICLPGKSAADAEPIKERLLAQIGIAVAATASKIDPTFKLNYGIVELVPDAYLEQLLDQAVRQSYTINL